MTDLDPAPRTAEPVPDRTVERRRARRRHHVRVLGVLVVALGLLLAGAWQLVLPLFSQDSEQQAVPDYPGPGTGRVEVTIADPDPAAVATVLTDADVVASAAAFVTAYQQTPDAAPIRPGSYVLLQQMAAADAVVALRDPTNRADLTLTIPAGWRQTQILAKVAEVLGVPPEEVRSAASELSMPEGAGAELEGWLSAGTYTVTPSASAAHVLQQMLDRTVATLDERGVAPADRARVLVQASIVEAEVATAEDRGRVARVMANRLAGCADVGPHLQMNSTVAYGLGKSVVDLTLADLEDASTPFNTYVFEGLPPTPINSPSEESVDAVLAPPDGPWCYFVTVNLESGETRFTDDPAEHESNRAEYRQWLDGWQQEQSAAPSEDPSEDSTTVDPAAGEGADEQPADAVVLTSADG